MRYLRHLWLVLFLLCIPGCFGATLKLDSQFAPLLQITEAPDKVIPAHMITTIDETSYVSNLQQFLADYPLNSVGFTGVLLHERQHVIRENAYPGGTVAWLARYLIDRDFRWAEEKVGWKVEILYNRDHGMSVNASNIASILNADYRFGGRMVSYDEAYNWVLDVVAGKQ